MYDVIERLESTKLDKNKILRIVFLFSGQVVYLPRERWELGRRNQEIKAQWGKKQIKELAEMFHLDESSIYRILKYGRNYTPPELEDN